MLKVESLPLLMSATAVTVLLHLVMTLFNYYMCHQLMLSGGDDSSQFLSPNLPVFLVLLWLLVSKPDRTLKKYGILLIQAEVCMQALNFMFMSGILSLRLCDLLPVREGTTIGSLYVFKILILVFSLYKGGMCARRILIKPESADSAGCGCAGSVSTQDSFEEMAEVRTRPNQSVEQLSNPHVSRPATPISYVRRTGSDRTSSKRYN